MDFGLSQDQLLMQDMLRRFLSEQVPIERVRKLRDEERCNDRDIWQALAELGLTGILVAEEHGGSALSLLDAVLVAQSMGYGVTPSAYLASAVMVPIALRTLNSQDSTAWLAGIASGKTIVGAAITETFSVREEANVTLHAKRLHGKAMMAIEATDADFILIALDNDDLAIVRADAPGLKLTTLSTIDATRCTTELVLDTVEPEAVFTDAAPAIARMLDAGRITLAGDQLGACEAMIEQAVNYAGQRRQFNRIIGSFQAVKHMCSEMIAELEPARSLVWYAAHSFDALPDEAPVMACHALAHVSEIARKIASVATQVHGGIGWTDDQNLHFWFKRIGVDRQLLGGPQMLRERAAQLQGFE